MLSTLPATLLGLVACALAQEANQTGPFNLHITGAAEGSSLDGHVASCHTGAALEALCYNQGQVPGEGNANSFEYWFNSTGQAPVGSDEVGILVWKLPVTINGSQTLVDQALSFQYQPSSNVAAPQIFFPDTLGSASVGFDDNQQLFVAAWLDDSTYEPGVRPAPVSEPFAVYNWFVCWQVLGGGYYYQALGWAQTLPPSNPTCEQVQITRVEA
jgi:hypothetical protein